MVLGSPAQLLSSYKTCRSETGVAQGSGIIQNYSFPGAKSVDQRLDPKVLSSL